MKVTIDRFEGDVAVLENFDLKIYHIRRDQLPEGSTESDVLDVVFNSDGSIKTVSIDHKAKQKMIEGMDRVRKKLFGQLNSIDINCTARNEEMENEKIKFTKREIFDKR